LSERRVAASSGEVHLQHPLDFAGRVEARVVESEALRGNPLGDPHDRELLVYVPPGAEGRRLPVIWVLCGFTGKPRKYLEAHPWKEGIVKRYDRAISAGEAPPALLALPDCWTRLGGSQYLDSTATGRYETHLVDELVPLVDELYPTLEERRGAIGKSSGGYGALRLGMRHADLFPAIASISGDCCFEYAFAHELLACLRGLVPHEMDPERFLAAFAQNPRLDGAGHAVLNVLAMSACYSPNPESPLGFDLPVDLETGARRADVWARWLAHDPVEMARAHADALRSLELLHLECGLRDEFHLQWGLRVLSKTLLDLGVPHHHEEHDAGHMDIDHRYGPLLAKLAGHLAGA
jgi:enterochelin esterase family protein